MEERKDMEIDLGVLLWNFWKILRRTWWLIPVLALLAATAGYVKASRFYTPMYQSSASFTVMTGGEDGQSYNFYYDTTTAGQLAKTFPYILGSSLLTDAMKEDMGTDVINGSVSAQAVSDSNLITMTATSSNPEDAKAILESAIRVYPDVARFVIGSTQFNMIDVPTLPTEPYNRPSYTHQVEKWALMGAAAAVFLIALAALLRKTVQKPEELKEVMSLQCIGNIPEVHFKARSRSSEQAVSIRTEGIPQGFKESFVSLQVRLEREMENRNAKILMVTSTAAGEGKSVTAVNLALTAASHGKKVLLIDGDLRRQDTRKRITEKQGNGLEAVVNQGVPLKDALFCDTSSGIWLLAGDKPAQHVPKILNSPAMREALETCREEMDLIIVDAPPCGMFEDAGVWAEYAECILYVVRHDFVQRRRIQDGISVLEDGRAAILGFAFNQVPVHRGGYGYYGYGRYGYGYYGYGKYGYGKYGYANYGDKADNSEREPK